MTCLFTWFELLFLLALSRNIRNVLSHNFGHRRQGSSEGSVGRDSTHIKIGATDYGGRAGKLVVLVMTPCGWSCTLIQVAVFWVVTPCSDVVGYHYTVSQPRIPLLEAVKTSNFA